jgi:hypothetical protein
MQRDTVKNKMKNSSLVRTLRSSAILVCLLQITSCAVPGIFWEKSEYQGPIIAGSVRADVFSKCDLGPSGLSDVVRCKWAFVDSQGQKINVSKDVLQHLDDYVLQVPLLKPWVKVPQSRGSPRASETGLVPFRLHLITISPVVLLAVPRQVTDPRDWCSGRYFEQGCLPSSVFDLEPYWYKRRPRAIEGSFWVIPSQNRPMELIKKVDVDVLLELADSKLRLSPRDGFWLVTREMSVK